VTHLFVIQELKVNPGFSEVLYIVRNTPEEVVSRVQCSVQGSPQTWDV